MSTTSKKPSTGKGAVKKKAISKPGATTKKPAKKAVAKAKKDPKVKGEDNTLKPVIAKFLEGKEFLNSRKALAAFKKEHSKMVVSRGYFYSMFKTFGTRVMKRDAVLVHVKTCKESIGKRSYRNYCADLAKKSEKLDAPIKPVRFVYFLKYWKLEKGISVIKARKDKSAKAVKVTIKVGDKAPKKKAPAKVVAKKKVAKPVTVKSGTAKKTVTKKPVVAKKADEKKDNKEVVAESTAMVNADTTKAADAVTAQA